MGMFRKKPVVIEARQVQFEDHKLWDWMGDAYKGHTESEGVTCHMKVETLEGLVTADHGDWIVKGVKGEFYPVKPDIFEMTYEKVD